ncbi:MAG: argininosuccinate lyase [Candidatus Micrarchaeota archaeon]
MKKMLWGGRFTKEPSSDIIEFNSGENAELDSELIPYDILGSLAHARMLYEQEILSTAEYEAINKALRSVYSQWERGIFRLKKEFEDVHMNVEIAVTKATPAGKKLHTARSRNDQVLLDMRMYMRDGILGLLDAIESLQEAFVELGETDGPMAAYTHTRVAQPITVSFWCESWVESLKRDKKRLIEAYSRVNQNPLGACAVAGTAWKIDRKKTAVLLGFEGVQENELDTISSRGECEAELLAICSIIACKLSRLSEEAIWLSQKGLIGIAEEFTTGSSIMPNKKNPDALELIRGRSGRVYGTLVHALTALKGTLGGYNSDMQETKYALMSGLETARSCLETAAIIVRGISFNEDAISRELDQGFSQATEIADYLAMGGVPFREAHEKAGNLVRHCEKSGSTISTLDNREASKVLGKNISPEAWAGLRGFSRPRLERKLTLENEGFAGKERKRLMQIFEELV